MSEAFTNLMTFATGAVGGAIGFIVIGFIIVVFFVPLFHFFRSRTPEKKSGLSTFSASLDHPDEGYHDRLDQPDRPASGYRRSDDRPVPQS